MKPLRDSRFISIGINFEVNKKRGGGHLFFLPSMKAWGIYFNCIVDS